MGSYKLRFGLGLLGAALGSLMLGCTAHQQPSRIETTLANMAKDVVIPMEAEDKKDPLPDSQDVLNQGRELFVQSCAICHGADGRGGPYIGRNMYPPAMDMNSPHVQHWSDADLFWIIQNGVRLTGMPSWESSISETDTWKLVRFIHGLPRLNAAPPATPATLEALQANLKPDAESVKYGKILYRQEGCFTCHSLNGEGGSVGPDLTTEGSRSRTTEWLVGHFKDPPAYVHGSVMPPFKNLTDEQLRALTGFLQNQKSRGK